LNLLDGGVEIGFEDTCFYILSTVRGVERVPFMTLAIGIIDGSVYIYNGITGVIDGIGTAGTFEAKARNVFLRDVGPSELAAFVFVGVLHFCLNSLINR
jgi:hypothetical protein